MSRVPLAPDSKSMCKYPLQPMKGLVITAAIRFCSSLGGHTHRGIKQGDCPEQLQEDVNISCETPATPLGGSYLRSQTSWMRLNIATTIPPVLQRWHLRNVSVLR